MDNLHSQLLQSKLSSSNDFQRKYISPTIDNMIGQWSQDTNKDNLKQQIGYINSTLDTLGIHRLGNLFTGDLHEIQITIDVQIDCLLSIKTLIQQKQKQLESRNNDKLRLKKIESERDDLHSQKERWVTDRQNMELDKERMIKKLRDVESFYKQTINKLTAERDDLSKQLAKSIGKEQQFKNQLKKRDNTITQLQESIKKIQGDKTLPYKNSYQVLKNLQQSGPFIYFVNAQHEFSQMFQKNFEEIYDRITNQNKYYRQCLVSVYREMAEVLEFKKDLLIRRRGLEGDDSGDISSMNLSTFRSQLLNMPQENSKQAIELLDDNVKKFKEYMERMEINDSDFRSNDSDMERLKGVKNIKNLLKKYKYIVETQDGLLNKLVLKAKDLKMNEPAQKGYRVDNHELEKAKRFIEEQKGYLQSKAKDIETTKKAMASSLRKIQEERNEMQRKKKEIEDQTLRIKKQIELMPANLEKEM